MTIPDTMSAVVLRGRGFENLALETVSTPMPGAGQLLARVDCAGICASLIKTVAQGSGHPYFYGLDLAAYPAILGDEGSVTIAAAGENLRLDYRVGDRFVVQPAVDHQPVNWLNRYPGDGRDISKVACGYSLPGHLAEYMLIPEEVLLAGCLLPVPSSDLPFAHASLAEPFSCCVSGQSHLVHLVQENPGSPRTARTGLKPGGVLFVAGLGTMGRMNIETALAAGAKRIIASDPMEDRRQLAIEQFTERARRDGASITVVSPECAPEAVRRWTDGSGVDDLIVAAGSAKAVESSLRLLRRGGAMNVFGGLAGGRETVKMDANAIHYNELLLTGSSGGTPRDLAEALDFMCEGRIDPASHIGRVGGLEHALECIRDLRDQKLEGRAVLYPQIKVRRTLEVRGWNADDEAEFLS